MGRGVSAGGGQSSLGYLFGNGESPKPAPEPVDASAAPPAPKPAEASAAPPAPKPTESNAALPAPKSSSPPVDNSPQIPAGIQGGTGNNYFRADGQNSGNFLTDRPSTKVHAAPGGGSSLGYLFGDGGN